MCAMQKTLLSKSELADGLLSVWLMVSLLAGIAGGALTAILVLLSPAIAIAWLIVEAARAL